MQQSSIKTSEDDLKSHRKTRKGVVVSNKMNKTLVVKVTRRIRHEQYGKVMITSKKYYAHDETEQAKEGDHVEIIETRPISKLKRWRLVTVMRPEGESS